MTELRADIYNRRPIAQSRSRVPRVFSLDKSLLIGITVLGFVPLLAFLVVLIGIQQNFESIRSYYLSQSTVVLFLRNDNNAMQAQKLIARLEPRSEIRHVVYYSSDNGFKRLNHYVSTDILRSYLPHNPLPNVLEISLARSLSYRNILLLVHDLSVLPEVDHLYFDANGLQSVNQQFNTWQLITHTSLLMCILGCLIFFIQALFVFRRHNVFVLSSLALFYAVSAGGLAYFLTKKCFAVVLNLLLPQGSQLILPTSNFFLWPCALAGMSVLCVGFFIWLQIVSK